jgi:hypothetical protein
MDSLGVRVACAWSFHTPRAPTNRRRHDARLPGSSPCLAPSGVPANGASPMLRWPATIKLNSLSYPPGPRRRLRCRCFFSCTLVHSSRSFVATSQLLRILFVSVAVRQSSPASPPAFCNIYPLAQHIPRGDLSPHPKLPASGCILCHLHDHPALASLLQINTPLLPGDESWPYCPDPDLDCACRQPSCHAFKPSHPGLSNLPE